MQYHFLTIACYLKYLLQCKYFCKKMRATKYLYNVSNITFLNNTCNPFYLFKPSARLISTFEIPFLELSDGEHHGVCKLGREDSMTRAELEQSTDRAHCDASEATLY